MEGCVLKALFGRLYAFRRASLEGLRAKKSLERLKAIEDRRSSENRLWRISTENLNGELQRRNKWIETGKGQIPY